MTRVPPFRSILAIIRERAASRMRCRTTGCSAESIKNSQNSDRMSIPYFLTNGKYRVGIVSRIGNILVLVVAAHRPCRPLRGRATLTRDPRAVTEPLRDSQCLLRAAPGQRALTSMLRRRLTLTFGSSTRSTPFLYEALALSASTSAQSGMARSKLP